MKHEVPFYSQYDDVERSEWKSKSCTITCLKMALDALCSNRAPSIDHLIDEGVLIGGRNEHGWIHGKVAIIAHNYGVPAYAEEFRSITVQSNGKSEISPYEESITSYGIHKLHSLVRARVFPIVSVPRNMEQSGSFHSILLIGYEEVGGTLTGFYYHDPDTEKERREGEFVSIGDFARLWRKMAICIGEMPL